jgi:hypothetical protein
MEAHFLAGMVEGEPGFKPGSWYNPYGDCIVFVMADEARIADRIDHVLTIYRSAIDNRPIGYQIKGAFAIVRRFGLSGLEIQREADDDELLSVSVAGLLLAAYGDGSPTVFRREGYTIALEQKSPPVRIKRSELVPA